MDLVQMSKQKKETMKKVRKRIKINVFKKCEMERRFVSKKIGRKGYKIKK